MEEKTHFKAHWLIFLTFMVCLLPPISALSVDIPIPTNYSLIPTVNSSDFWDNLDSPSDILHNLLSNLAWSVAGHTIDTDFDIAGYNIINVDFINANFGNFSNITSLAWDNVTIDNSQINWMENEDLGSYNLTTIGKITAGALKIDRINIDSDTITHSGEEDEFTITSNTLGSFCILAPNAETGIQINAALGSIYLLSDWTAAGQTCADLGTVSAGALHNDVTHTQWDAAYSHSLDNSQAHTDYMLNSGDTSTGNYNFGGNVFTIGLNATGETNLSNTLIGGDTNITGDANIGGAVNTPKLYNSAGDLAIMLDGGNNVKYFEDKEYGDAEDSNAVYIYRKSTDGPTQHFKFYISQHRQPTLFSSGAMEMRVNNAATFRSLTSYVNFDSDTHMYFDLGDTIGANHFYIRDSGLNVVVDIDSDGNAQFDGDIHIDDNLKSLFGTGKDASIYYNASDMIFNPLEVGSGDGWLLGDWHITGNIINDAIYCESSELVDQVFDTAGVRYRLNISNVDEGNGISMSTGNNGTNITIDTAGVYHMVSQPQVKAGAVGGGKGDFHMWIEKNTGSGFVDVPDSNIELSLGTNEEDVIVLATTLKLNQGDVLRFVASVSDNKILLHAQTPAGEPTIPSIIFTMYRVGS